MDFLYKAQLERKKAENGVGDDVDVGDVDTDVNLPANPSNVSAPNGGPPINGSARRF